VRFREGHRATEPPAPSGVGARKVRPSNAGRLNRRAGTEATAARRFDSGRLPGGNGEQLKATAVCSARGHRCTVCDLRSSPSVFWTAWCPRGHPKSSHRDTHAVAGCFGLVRTAGERIARTLFGAREPPRSMRWCQRRRDWSVWTRDPDTYNADAPPLLRVGWQRPRMRQPPAGGQKIASPVALARPGFRYGPHRLTAGLRGSNGSSSELPQTRPETVGPHLNFGQPVLRDDLRAR
jgi:hypothetical protein